jgi:hypothetical protein
LLPHWRRFGTSLSFTGSAAMAVPAKSATASGHNFKSREMRSIFPSSWREGEPRDEWSQPHTNCAKQNTAHEMSCADLEAKEIWGSKSSRIDA